jgi:outer membrane lipoprotein SlyB
MRSVLVLPLLLPALCYLGTVQAHAQQPILPLVSSSDAAAASASAPSLPEDPSALQAVSTSAATGTIHGSVTDQSGALVPYASVILLAAHDASTHPTSLEAARTITDASGNFTLSGVPAGSFRIAIAAVGMLAKEVDGTLQAGATLQLPTVQLRIASDTEVNVTFTQKELAQAEMQMEEKQRVLGIFPNFGVAYDWNAPPMTTAQKYNVAFKSVVDPVSLLFTAAVAGIQQANNTYSGFGSGPAAYGKRFGAALATGTTETFLNSAILPQVFHQDPRYFWKGTGTRRQRLLYALSTTFRCRSDRDGHWETNYSNILSAYGAGALSNLYYPAANRNGAGLTIANGTLALAGSAVNSVVEEFFSRRFTPHLPPANPAPVDKTNTTQP